MARPLTHFALGPVRRSQVDSAMAKSALDQTAWERGIASAASAFDRKRSPLGALQAVRLVPPLWSFVVMCDAPRRQRNEARLYASSLEHQVTAYKEWVRRRQIGEDFKEEALGLVNTLPYQLQHVYDIETATADWRTRLQIVGRQLEAHEVASSVPSRSRTHDAPWTKQREMDTPTKSRA